MKFKNPKLQEKNETQKIQETAQDSKSTLPQDPTPQEVFNYFEKDLREAYNNIKHEFAEFKPLNGYVIAPIFRKFRTQIDALVERAKSDFTSLLHASGMTLEEAQHIAQNLAQRSYIDLQVPRYFDFIKESLPSADEYSKPIAERLLQQRAKFESIAKNTMKEIEEIERIRAELAAFDNKARTSQFPPNEADTLMQDFIEKEARKTQAQMTGTQNPQNTNEIHKNEDSIIKSTGNNVAIQNEVKEMPIKTRLEKDLSPDEIMEVVNKWDLANPKASDKLIISKVGDDELAQLMQDFHFKGNYAIAREIDAQHIAHALNKHGDDANPANISITKEEIFQNYPAITKEYDERVVTNNNRIIYAKQINGHFVVIEEVMQGRNKLKFVSAWKQKGKLNKETLFKNAKN